MTTLAFVIPNPHDSIKQKLLEKVDYSFYLSFVYFCSNKTLSIGSFR